MEFLRSFLSGGVAKCWLFSQACFAAVLYHSLFLKNVLVYRTANILISEGLEGEIITKLEICIRCV